MEKGHLTMMELIGLMSWKPAKFYGLDAGYLAGGGPGDCVIFDSKEKWKVEGFFSKSDNSPFLGEVLSGKVYYTVCNGRIVYQQGN